MRPVTVRRVSTLPCTRSLSSHSCTQDLRSPVLFCRRKYLLNISASGIFLILDRTSSLTIIFSLSVNFVGFHPNSIRRSAICLRLAMLKGISLIFVFNCSFLGGKVVSAHSSSSDISSSSFAKSSWPFIILNANPFCCCLSTITLMSLSNW